MPLTRSWACVSAHWGGQYVGGCVRVQVAGASTARTHLRALLLGPWCMLLLQLDTACLLVVGSAQDGEVGLLPAAAQQRPQPGEGHPTRMTSNKLVRTSGSTKIGKALL